ncbi:hypothetical protein NW754_010775 [Fusarium falciforme]|uniref:Uncharacterized protein n=1 Tax=Fusarium falciforme TaxID=195108 RepID=A0A9W8R232_9HYPO|nr:Hypothetical protein NCS54_00940500 [Fusarium falciforme]KAJ4168843.1 hypothetical protein NW754_010775 [Fusarium falciforme]KAJ4184660.1 hypothetical protein NW755_009115 [Fusarium falciforme]KAJ4204512.1 hypothetical protein NW767_004705 [Fusarium falciforme]KAJ4255345.1 hypothetical protein NW757_004862 [Fusarium falciforme]WAO91920.1 Hypothetical protein NCS54_00940500 [Fusarium falciforme]
MRYLALPFVVVMLTSPIAAFDICKALHCYEEPEPPAVWVTLKAVDLKDRNYQPTIRVDLTESDQICDPSKVEVFMQSLAIDKDGRGEGSIMLDPETWAKSSWEFSCSTPKDSSKEHKLSFTIHAINGEEIEKMTFVTRFRQMWPIIFTSVESDSMAETPEFSRGTLYYVPEGGYRFEDYEEL